MQSTLNIQYRLKLSCSSLITHNYILSSCNKIQTFPSLNLYFMFVENKIYIQHPNNFQRNFPLISLKSWQKDIYMVWYNNTHTYTNTTTKTIVGIAFAVCRVDDSQTSLNLRTFQRPWRKNSQTHSANHPYLYGTLFIYMVWYIRLYIKYPIYSRQCCSVVLYKILQHRLFYMWVWV